MLGLIFIGVGVVLLVQAAEIGFWELIFAIPLIYSDLLAYALDKTLDSSTVGVL